MLSNFIFEALALIAALYNLKYIRNTRYFYFIPFLAFTLMGELGGQHVATKYPTYKTGNFHIYLWITIFFLIFFGYQFHEIFRSKIWKWITVIGITLVVSILLIWFCFFPVYTQLYLNTHVVGGFLLCCLSCAYIYQEFIAIENYDMNLFHSPDFWLVIGVLLYYAGNSIVFVFHDFLKDNPLYVWDIKLYHLFPRFLSIFLYSFIILALFLWRINKKKFLDHKKGIY